ncbi:MAG: efflux transporter outer membrane subunit [Methylophilaceae bacterium]|nr:efflux transporter outer membrane subunit [Methylophilaceae bacterium]
MRLLLPIPRAWTLVLTLLAGCSLVGPDYVQPELRVPDQWVHSAAYSTESQDLSRWWERLDDPVLTSLIERAIHNSPDIRSALAKLREARARRSLAGGNRFPTVDARFSASRSRNGSGPSGYTTSHLYDAGFDAAWEPDVFGRLGRALEAAEAGAEASRADLQAAQVSLAAEVALNYVELRSYQQRLAIARDNLAIQSETLQITDWRAQAGLATALEVEQARSNRAQTEASLPVLDTSLAEAENRLAVLTGQAPGALHDLLETAAPLPTVPEQVAIGIPADTLRQRPDVRAAERRLAAETARIGQETAALYPAFALNGSFGWKAISLGALGGAGSVASTLAGSVLQNVFDAGRIRSRIAIQNAVQQQALAAYEKTVLTALEEVENALAAYAGSRERQAALRQAVQSARNAAQLARQRFESGLVDFQKVLDTERTRLASEDALATAEAEGLTALIRLYKALGGGWQDTEPPDERATP